MKISKEHNLLKHHYENFSENYIFFKTQTNKDRFLKYVAFLMEYISFLEKLPTTNGYNPQWVPIDYAILTENIEILQLLSLCTASSSNGYDRSYIECIIERMKRNQSKYPPSTYIRAWNSWLEATPDIWIFH